MRLYFEGYVDIDPDSWFDKDDVESEQWFYNEICKNDLILHSNEIGDALGDFVVTELEVAP